MSRQDQLKRFDCTPDAFPAFVWSKVKRMFAVIDEQDARIAELESELECWQIASEEAK